MTIAFVEHAPFAIYTVGGLALLGIAVGVPVAHWISGIMANFLTFFPTTKFNRPVPLISRGRALSMDGKLTEAAAVYESLLVDHPENLEIYINLVDLAFGPLDDHDYGNEIIQSGDEHLTERGQRVLRIHREAILRGELYPLQHLGWQEDPKSKNHPKVVIPEALKGQFLPKATEE